MRGSDRGGLIILPSDVASDTAVNWLRLHLVPGIGPRRLRGLIERFGDVSGVLSASSRALRDVPGIGAVVSEALRAARDDDRVHHELRRAASLGVRILCLKDEGYPGLLKELPDAPACLYMLGQQAAEDRAALAIVGSRRCTRYGLEQAYAFGMAAARVGLTVVSGLARGVDAQAHRAALDCAGRTVAVLGCGLGQLPGHPNAELADRIVTGGGAVLSELPIDRPPSAENFPPRNRIIAGLSLGTLVIEAARSSGALITARLASEYNREVFALPGRVDSAYSAGTLALLQAQHARMTLSIDDILAELQHARGPILDNYRERADRLKQQAAALEGDERILLQALTTDGVDLEHLLEHTGLPPERISSGLTALQLKGLAEYLPGNRFACVGL